MIKKKEIIGEYKDNSFITEVLKWTLDPYKTYNVTSKNCKKLSHLIDDYHHDSLFDLLNKLDNRTFTGHEAIAMVNGYCAAHEKWIADLVYCIIDRNLQIRANTSLINKVIPGLIPEFKIALANKYDHKYINFEKDKNNLLKLSCQVASSILLNSTSKGPPVFKTKIFGFLCISQN